MPRMYESKTTMSALINGFCLANCALLQEAPEPTLRGLHLAYVSSCFRFFPSTGVSSSFQYNCRQLPGNSK